MSRQHQRFSKSQLLYAYLPKYKGEDKRPLENTSRSVAKEIAQGRFYFSEINIGNIKGTEVIRFKRLKDNVVAEKINDNLKRAYSIRPPSRDEIVSQLCILLKEGYPKSILRLDINSFYSSIDIDILFRKLDRDSLMTYETRRILQDQLQSIKSQGIDGLPRGMSISATLSEIFMKEIDIKIRSLSGIYYYSRYVDDIVILSTKSSNETLERVEEIISEFNLCTSRKEEKHTKHDLFEPFDGTKYFEYLGYKFGMQDNGNHFFVDISISEKKIKKIKTRIVKALLASSMERDFDLLNDRIKFLAGHYPVYKGGRKIGGLRNGLGYNYKYINNLDQLSELDSFKSKTIFSTKPFSHKTSSWMSSGQKRAIARISFKKSFISKRYYGFRAERISRIMKIFRGV